jgi:hypothetical protein
MPLRLRSTRKSRDVAGLGQRLLVGLAGGLLDGLGKFHLGALAVERGEAERPCSVASVADHQIEPATIGIDARLQRFNLVGVEGHFNVP